MAVSLKTYRRILNEDQRKIQEIGQRLPPFQTEFNIIENNNGYESSFLDPDNNKIKILFHQLGSDNNGY